MHFGSEASDRCAFVFGMYLLCKLRGSAGRRIRVVAITERSRQAMGSADGIGGEISGGSRADPRSHQLKGKCGGRARAYQPMG